MSVHRPKYPFPCNFRGCCPLSPQALFFNKWLFFSYVFFCFSSFFPLFVFFVSSFFCLLLSSLSLSLFFFFSFSGWGTAEGIPLGNRFEMYAYQNALFLQSSKENSLSTCAERTVAPETRPRAHFRGTSLCSTPFDCAGFWELK